MEERKHFVLVHGSCLGAWCWYKVVTLLKLAGHHVSAIDLGASGVNSKRLDDEIASISDYLQPLMEFMACLPQEKKDPSGVFTGLPIYIQQRPGKSANFSSLWTRVHEDRALQALPDLELTKMLVRPTGFFVEDLSKESLLTKEKFGSVDRVYVICKEDEVMKEDFQRAMIEDYHPKQVVSISAAGHMVMLSKPEELCQILLEDIAHK
ncbi:methylesterase 10 [Citrus sinensis]|nr:methylesterase 10 [Citrus sinensis]